MSKNIRNSLRDQYPMVLEKSTILTLLLVIFLFLMFPKFEIKKSIEITGSGYQLTVEHIPITRQGVPRKPPPRPVVPIPSEDDIIPENVTIEDTDLTFENFSLTTGPGLPLDRIDIIQPRPIFEVIPEYSEELQKKGIEGLVKLHLHIDQTGRVIEAIVLENTTGSSTCARAAQEAALKGRYIPSKRNGEPTDLWISRSYTFGLLK